MHSSDPRKGPRRPLNEANVAKQVKGARGERKQRTRRVAGEHSLAGRSVPGDFLLEVNIWR